MANYYYNAASEPVPVGSKTVYNLLDMGGYWSEHADGNGSDYNRTDFAVGALPLHISHSRTFNGTVSICQDPKIYLNTGTPFETLKQGAEITIVFMFPSLTSNLTDKGQTILDIDGAEFDGADTSFEARYYPTTNRLDIKTRSSGVFGIGAFESIFSEVTTEQIVDNSGTIIGVSVIGVLRTTITRISIAPYFESDKAVSSPCTSTLTFASYDDLQITVETEDEPEQPETDLTNIDLYRKINGKPTKLTLYKKLGGNLVKVDEYAKGGSA